MTVTIASVPGKIGTIIFGPGPLERPFPLWRKTESGMEVRSGTPNRVEFYLSGTVHLKSLDSPEIVGESMSRFYHHSEHWIRGEYEITVWYQPEPDNFSHSIRVIRLGYPDTDVSQNWPISKFVRETVELWVRSSFRGTMPLVEFVQKMGL